MPRHTLKTEIELPDGVDGDELVCRVSQRVLALLQDEAQLMHGGFEETRHRSARATRELMVGRGYLSCADPRLRPLQKQIMDIVGAEPSPNDKPVDVARRLAKTFPHLYFDWRSWYGDELSIACTRKHLQEFADTGWQRYDWISGADDCIRCGAYAAGGPYVIGSGPLPVIDSHPGCVCLVAAHSE